MSSCFDITNHPEITVQPFQAARPVIMSLLPQLPQAGSPDIYNKMQTWRTRKKKQQSSQAREAADTLQPWNNTSIV